jgi:glycosyltransferase involved in cell wall biosynthesis
LKPNLYVISCERNAGIFSIKCLKSIKNQTFQAKKHFYIDDCSDDGTQDHIKKLLSSENFKNVEFIENQNRLYKNENMHITINRIEDDEGVVIIVDGDDWLHSVKALEIIANEYDKNSKLEYVYSNWMYSHNKEFGISKSIPNHEWDPYTNEWITSALTTFKVKTYKKIPESNFKDENKKFLKSAGVQACNLALLKYLKITYGNYDAVKYIDLPLYVYQRIEGNKNIRFGNEGKEYLLLEKETNLYIRNRGFLTE